MLGSATERNWGISMVGTVSRLNPDSFDVDSMDLGFVFRSGIFGMLVEFGLEALSKSGVVIGGAEAGGMVLQWRS